MDSRATSAALLLSFLLFSAASAFNITKLLSQFPDFNNLNDVLTQTNLAGDINSRKTITILALDNGAVSGLSGKPLDVLRRILSVHVILDYYDAQKLARLSSDNTTVLTTLFQASGAARNQQGFIKVTQIGQGEIAFGSAVRGTQFDSRLVKSVVAQPYNICVLQISSPIQVPGIDAKPPRSSPSSPPPASFSPVGSPKKAPAPSAKTPSKARAPPAKKPKVVADSPARSPPKAADGEDDAAAPAPSDKSGASHGSFIGAAAVMAVISVFLAL
ncbi:fasciclin-like arabinogalactan protein 14 [Cucurbita maxima]|uniref:Fasciclin-like arabinogalactan protein 14 n=1 Tax=Cucurbita maxima TaxID=3661 RepID=A0A6J1IIS9_CUCMA|nr:fasciclin-like arabinogalactan protein 14 [Cucurbita maxima]